MEAECNSCDFVCGGRFPGRFVLKKNSLMTDVLRSIVSLGNIGVMGNFSEVASLVKAPLGNTQKHDVILMIPLDDRPLDRYRLGEECPDDRCPHCILRRIISSREIETIDVMSSKVAIIVFLSSAGEILETGCHSCDS